MVKRSVLASGRELRRAVAMGVLASAAMPGLALAAPIEMQTGVGWKMRS